MKLVSHGILLLSQFIFYAQFFLTCSLSHKACSVLSQVMWRRGERQHPVSFRGQKNTRKGQYQQLHIIDYPYLKDTRVKTTTHSSSECSQTPDLLSIY